CLNRRPERLEAILEAREPRGQYLFAESEQLPAHAEANLSDRVLQVHKRFVDPLERFDGGGRNRVMRSFWLRHRPIIPTAYCGPAVVGRAGRIAADDLSVASAGASTA